MARPAPVVVLESIDPKTYRAEQVLDADTVYAVFYRDRPINLRTLNKLISTPGPKYKKTSFQNPGSALALAKRLNNLFGTDEFVVRELMAGNIYTGKKT